MFPTDRRARRRRPVSYKITGSVFLSLVLTLVSSIAIVEGFCPATATAVSAGQGETKERKQRRRTDIGSFSAKSKSDDEKDSSDDRKTNNKERHRSEHGLKRTRDGFSINDGAVNISIAERQAPSPLESELLNRVGQLEQIVARQSVEMKRLQQECTDLTHAAAAFARVVELLRAAGLQTTDEDDDVIASRTASSGASKKPDFSEAKSQGSSAAGNTVVESFDDEVIFGTAPVDVIEAADVAGASILAGILGGKQRMLVDVRDADLSSDPETLVQFIELAILPVAAGLEGLNSKRNRLKIVFPTVSQLMHYRKTMALAAPEVVALSTLGFDPVEDKDNLVVILAPAPEDEDGHRAMNALLRRDEEDFRSPAESNATAGIRRKPIRQPVVVLNHHMMPLAGPAAKFEVAYHLRLLSVQYMSGGSPQDYFSEFMESRSEIDEDASEEKAALGGLDDDDTNNTSPLTEGEEFSNNNTSLSEEEEALEAAMEHAHQGGVHSGVTRAMVVRAFPRPWHVFVDTSPDTDADFEVAATFDQEPTADEVNLSIVECLEGSEQEDELVAKQMQQALETGQLDRVSELLGSLGFEAFDEKDSDDEDEDSDDDDDETWDLFREDSV